MNNLSIFFENKSQKTLLQLIINEGTPTIEEVTTYLREDGEINTMVQRREVYNADTNSSVIKMFFNSKIQATAEFFQSLGKFRIEVK